MTDQTNTSALGEALNQWRLLMRAQIRLRQRIHHQHELIIGQLETAAERAEMRANLARADALLSELQTLAGEV